MSRMKNRQEFPPGGWQFTQAQTNWSATPGSFTSVVTQVVQHRRGNKAVTAQYRLNTQPEDVELEIEDFNAKRCISHGWLNFVVEAPIQNFNRPTVFHSLSQSAVGKKAKTIVAGVRSIALWLGDGLRPVAQPLAESRAKICADRDGKPCPLNGSVNFTEEVMAQIREWIAIKNDLALKTSHDAKLGSCLGCSCDLKTKVHAPIKVAGNMSAEVLAKLDPQCWVLSELKQESEAKPA